jgi:Inorganic pyrophosphatase
MEGTGQPDYARCVEISTVGAQREMVLPSLIAVVVPVVVGLFMGVAGVFGLLVGGLASGFALATMLNMLAEPGTMRKSLSKRATMVARAPRRTSPPSWAIPWAIRSRIPRPLAEHPHQAHDHGERGFCRSLLASFGGFLF